MSTSKRTRTAEKTDEDETPITDSTEHFYADGDIMIISSDNRRYKVHKYQLQAASTVFRHMLGQSNAADPEETIRLYDTDIEDSTALNAMFNTLYNGVIPDPFVEGVEAGPIIISIKAWKFFNKYECVLSLRALAAAVDADVWGEGWADAFIFGAATRQNDICQSAVQHAMQADLGDWGNSYPEDLGDWGRGSCANIFGQPYDKLKLVPLPYLVAFQRATQTPLDGPNKGPAAIRDRFRDLMATAVDI